MGAEPGSGIVVCRQLPTQQVMSQGRGPSEESRQQQKRMGPETGLETGHSDGPKSIHWETSRDIKASVCPQGPDICL